MKPSETRKPRYGGNRSRASDHSSQGRQSKSSAARAASLPNNWRDRLPDPASYYVGHVEKMSRPNATGWAQGQCPFHEDGNASLSVHVTDARGGWRCFAGCGGGDLVGFHMRRTGLAFRDAVADLLRWRI
jgi:hypothetical protein